MGLFSDSLAYSSDTTATQAGDYTFGEKAGAVVAGALVSGLGSIYNTGVGAVNALGGDAEEISTYNTLSGIDTNWAEYYKKHETAIDVGGFIATSLLPGGLAVKGLNAFRAGETANAFGRGLNFARTQQARLLSQGLDELAIEGGSVFTRLNKNKLGAMAWETADQTLQAATFELAVALTMKQSPLLADDSWWDIGKGIATGAVLGGAIGGGIGSLLINKGFKDATKALDLVGNKYTALSGLENLGLAGGDQAYGIINAVTKVPESVLEADKIMNFSFNLGSGKEVYSKDVSAYLAGVAKQSTKAAMQDFELQLRKLAGAGAATGEGDASAADAMAKFILGKYTELKAAGAGPIQIREQLGDNLFNLTKVSAATEERLYNASDLMYFKKSLTPEELTGIKSIEDLQDMVAKNTPFGGKGKDAYSEPYVFLGTPEQYAGLKTAVVGTGEAAEFPTLKAAWEAGYHVAMQQDGTLRINAGGGMFRRVEDPIYDTRRYLNTRTGAITEDTVLTAADKVTPGKSMKVSDWGVEYETPKGGTKRESMAKVFKEGSDLDYVTARHAWANKLPDAAVPSEINSRDFSLLERARSLSDDFKDELSIRMPDGSTIAGSNIEDFLLNAKVDGLRDAFLSGEKDIRALAYEFATTEKWIEKVVSSEFGSALRSLEPLKDGMSRNIGEFASRENLVAHYATADQFTALQAMNEGMSTADKVALIKEQVSQTGGQFVTGELAYAYRVQNAVKANQNAAAAVLGADKFATLIRLDQDAAKLADSLGAGATFLGAANASYGETLRLAAQDIGKKTHQWIQEASDNVASSFSTVSSKLLDNKAAAAELGIVTNILRNEGRAYVLDSTDLAGKRLILRDIEKIADPAKRLELETALKSEGVRTSIDVINDDTMAFLKTHQTLNADRVGKEGVLVNARGLTTNKDPAVFYAPPIDTNYFQHFAFVRGIEGKAFGTSEVAMIFGRDAAELQRRMSLVDREMFDVITKDGSERYFKAKGAYDFDQTINERNIDSALKRTGALANFFPETRAENVIEDYLKFHQNQASKLVRNAVESNYSQQVAELRQLGSSYVEDATSKFQGTLRSAKSEIVNPYDDVIKTMMDVSKRSEYTFFHQANEFVDALGTRAYAILSDVTGKAQKGLIDFTEANAIAEKHGIKGMYSDKEAYFLSNAPRDRNLIKESIARANTIISNLVLRFDSAQALMNVVSTPLLLSTELTSIRNLVAKDSELAGALAQLTSVKVPGQDVAVPSTMKLLGNSIKNYFGPDKDMLIARYTENGDIKGISKLYHEAIGDLGLSSDFKVFNDGVSRASEKLGKITGNNWAEEFTRFVSADVMKQVTDPLLAKGVIDLPTQNAYISTFVNRVQGNYVTSQRPVVFQGVLGGAVSLFQTYSFNLLQQLLRHVESGDKKAVATLFGMQTGLFGLNGLPMFDAVNTNLIGNAAINQGHYDAYSIAPGLLGKEMGDWLMYGSVSAMPLIMGDKTPALYSRGDINPRHMTILPMTPADIPAIDASVRTVKNLVDIGSKLVGGADVGQTLLQGLEHNGLNRPLAGLAQVLAGRSTTSKGNLISASSDMELVANASRILGAKPMDEAIALNNMYRIKSYVAADQDRMSALGERVKTALIGNRVPSTEDFNKYMKDYTAIGGRLESFNGSMQKWMRDANTSVIQSMTRNMNTPYAQRLSEIMGGTPLQDYRNTPASAAENADALP